MLMHRRGWRNCTCIIFCKIIIISDDFDEKTIYVYADFFKSITAMR
jgi:predicted nucleic acid-binding Zn finger protein